MYYSAAFISEANCFRIYQDEFPKGNPIQGFKTYMMYAYKNYEETKAKVKKHILDR